MKLLIGTVTSIFLSASLTLAHGGTPGVAKAKAAELSAHRIDRLVTLGKIDASFLKNLEKIEVTVVQNQAPVFYKVRVSQTLPAQGTPLQVDLSFDDDGKPLASQVIPGGTAGPDAGWPDKDPVSPFYSGLSSIALTKGALNGNVVVRGQITSSETTSKLNVYLKTDGTFVSAEVTP